MSSLNTLTDIKIQSPQVNPWIGALKADTLQSTGLATFQSAKIVAGEGKQAEIKFYGGTDLSGYMIYSNGPGGFGLYSIASSKVLVAMSDTYTEIAGTVTANNATAGYVGEYKQTIFGPSSIAATGVYQNLANLQLTSGDWDVHLSANWSIDNKTDTLAVGISTDQTATTFTDLVEGSNNCRYASIGLSSGVLVVPTLVSSVRISLSATTSIQVKVTSNFTGAQPTSYGRISARRVR